MPGQFEILMIEQMRNIAACAGEKIIDAQHLMPFVQKPVTQMAADKAGATSD